MIIARKKYKYLKPSPAVGFSPSPLEELVPPRREVGVRQNKLAKAFTNLARQH